MDTLLHALKSSAAEPWSAPLQALRDGLAAWQRRRQANAALRTLQALDNHALRDLGIDRSELPSLAHDPADTARARARWSC